MKVGEIRPWGDTTCGYGLTQSLCDRPATIHVMLEGEMCVNCCDEHYRLHVARDSPSHAKHAFVPGVCGEAGSWWFTPEDPDVDSWCHFTELPSRRTEEGVESWLAAEAPELSRKDTT